MVTGKSGFAFRHGVAGYEVQKNGRVLWKRYTGRGNDCWWQITLSATLREGLATLPCAREIKVIKPHGQLVSLS